MITLIILSLLFSLRRIKITACNENKSLTFPKGFLIGTASAAYQIEGAWNVSDKSENTWDYFTHLKPSRQKDQSTGDVSSDFYHKYKQDIKLLKSLGVDHFRLSISWSRVLPMGYPTKISREGLQFYHNILDELEKNDILPFVTIYHWDHPRVLQNDFGGWLNEKMAYVYAEFARIIFKEFGHRVKTFITINEPVVYCRRVFIFLSINSNHSAERHQYDCIQNMLKGHALAYHIYNDEFRKKYNGKLGGAFSVNYFFSKNKNDSLSNETAFQFQSGIALNPIYSKEGDYPKIVKETIFRRSKALGFKYSKLPSLNDYWISFIRGTYDFFGLNHYTSEIVEPGPKSNVLNWNSDDGLIHTIDSKWPSVENSPIKIVPQGLRNVLQQIKIKYNNPPVYVIENGALDRNGTNDIFRINYIRAYVEQMLVAINQDGCDVRAYTYWSFLDSFEWFFGYNDKYGLVDVNFGVENRTRTLKKSFIWLRNMIKCRNSNGACEIGKLLKHKP